MSKNKFLIRLAVIDGAGAMLAHELQKHTVLNTDPPPPVVLVDQPVNPYNKMVEELSNNIQQDVERMKRTVEAMELRKLRIKRKPVTGTRPPARNKPCPCGSNRKYKHCCNRKK